MKPYKMKDVCEAIQMPYETLRFYCNEGLVPNLERDENMHRLFDAADIAWLEGIQALRACDFSINELKEYMQLCFEGLASIDRRQVMLSLKREIILYQIQALGKSIEYIDQKNAFYDRVCRGEEAYHSNLISSQ